jgi:hypothetical protein
MNFLSAVAGAAIRAWLRLAGRKLPKAEVPWLSVPIGRELIGEEVYKELAAQQDLDVGDDAVAGLIPDFNTLRGPDFDPDRVRAEVRDFYEKTSQYQLEAWSETSALTRVFLWLLVTLLSRRMDQLNFPLSPLDTSRGMTSRVIPLRERGSGRVLYAGWLRKLSGTGRVVYAGLYGVGMPPGARGPCVRVSFPLPRGSATVFLRPEAEADGSFKLISAGGSFGDPGFYRMLDAGDGHWHVRYLRTLRESFHVFVDAEGILRTDHRVRFMGLPVLALHYKILPVRPRVL